MASTESHDSAGRPSHAFEEHTGEVMLRLTAPTEAELFVEAGLALAELMAGDQVRDANSEAERLVATARDRESLLVAFLNELIFRSETAKRVYSEFRALALSEKELQVEVRGFSPSHIRTAVKAATLHRVRVERDNDCYRAQVVLDV